LQFELVRTTLLCRTVPASPFLSAMSLPLLTATPMPGPVTEKRRARSVSLTPGSVTAMKRKTLVNKKITFSNEPQSLPLRNVPSPSHSKAYGGSCHRKAQSEVRQSHTQFRHSEEAENAPCLDKLPVPAPGVDFLGPARLILRLLAQGKDMAGRKGSRFSRILCGELLPLQVYRQASVDRRCFVIG